jgi:nucleoside-diphosphate-sugar epimerase
VLALVTGSMGFVGSHVVQKILAGGLGRNPGVIQADRKRGNNLEDMAEVERLFALKPDVVIHLASSCSTPGSVADPRRTWRDTVDTAVNVLEAARLREVPVVMTSSCKSQVPRPWMPKTTYGVAKLAVEEISLEYKRAYGLPVVVNRPGTIYGPGQEGSPESGWVAWFLEAKRLGKQVTIHGDGSQVRDLFHVDDYVRLLLTQAADPGAYLSDIWDVGGGERNAVSVRAMADYLKLDYVFGPPRYGDVANYVSYDIIPRWEPEVYWKESETLCQMS